MDEDGAVAVAEALGGRAWQSGGGIWLVRVEPTDGRLVIVSDDAVCDYANEEAFETNQPASVVVLH